VTVKHKLHNSKKTHIDRSPSSGRGVFASEPLGEGELIEQCHFIIPEQDKGGKDKELLRYMFAMTDEKSVESSKGEFLKIFLANLIDNKKEESPERSSAIKSCVELGYKSLDKLFDSAVVLGNGMIFNHSPKPNVNYSFNETDFCFDYHAVKNINKGEELLINYGNPEREDLK
jgi:SET domain-containing protein